MLINNDSNAWLHNFNEFVLMGKVIPNCKHLKCFETKGCCLKIFNGKCVMKTVNWIGVK